MNLGWSFRIDEACAKILLVKKDSFQIGIRSLDLKEKDSEPYCVYLIRVLRVEYDAVISVLKIRLGKTFPK